MEVPQICKEKWNMAEKLKGKKIGYSKLSSYSSNPLCSPFEKKIFMQDVEPSMELHKDMCPYNNECKNTNVYTFLNERGVKPSPYFQKIDGEYVSEKQDGRVIDAPRSIVDRFDIKPIQVVYDLINDNVSGNPALKNYGKNYTSYSNVTGGQIQYYIDKELAEPFNTPVYATKTQAVGFTYKDPMDSIKPQFEKAYPAESFSCLSSIDDTSSFRDDITARQQRTHNQQRYDLVYGRLM